MDPDQARRVAGQVQTVCKFKPGKSKLGPNCLQGLLADDTGRQRVKTPIGEEEVIIRRQKKLIQTQQQTRPEPLEQHQQLHLDDQMKDKSLSHLTNQQKFNHHPHLFALHLEM